MKSKFTFVEVLIASLILAFGAVAAVEMSSRAHLQTYDVEDQWAKEHLVALGAEYYLLFGHDAEFPSDMLPEGFSIDCELNEAPIGDDVNEEKYDPLNGWILGEYTIRLYSDGNEIHTLTIEKIVAEDDLQ
ncbi:MAG: hypothetical protein NE334_12110 [Lentisphaeraceae bacterium]|nr:hypothetical protein [Lentisphaeraceae bacterium]